MTQKAYLEQLEDALEALDPKDKDELMADFKEHFEIGLSEGKSEKEIIDSLGPLDELIQSLDLKRLENHKQKTDDFRKTFSSSIEKVIIDGVQADVTINASQDNQIHLDYEISKRILGKLSTEVTTKQEGNTLFVTVVNENRLFRNSVEPVDLSFDLPKTLIELVCKTASGDIRIDDCAVENLDLHSLSGDIGVDDFKAKSIKVVGVSSDIDLTKISGDLQIKTVSGDVNVFEHNGDTCNIESVSGDIEYDGTAKQMRVNTTSGDGSLKAPDIETMNINTVSGDFELELDIEKKGFTIAFISNSGSLNIGDAEYDTPRHNQTITIGDGSAKVNLKSVSGDFEIE
jgi:DUF4097 and DUF4098 domain-containing protein YvlB